MHWRLLLSPHLFQDRDDRSLCVCVRCFFYIDGLNQITFSMNWLNNLAVCKIMSETCYFSPILMGNDVVKLKKKREKKDETFLSCFSASWCSTPICVTCQKTGVLSELFVFVNLLFFLFSLSLFLRWILNFGKSLLSRGQSGS